MKTSHCVFVSRSVRLLAAALAIATAGACTSLRPAAIQPPVFYALDGGQGPAPRAAPDPGIPPTPSATWATAPVAAPTLIVNPPHAAAGFDSGRIIYVRTAHKIEYFAHSEWVEPPARMLAPLLIKALEQTGAFRAVTLAPSAAAGDLRLDTEIIRLQHEFGSVPSSVRFTLRAYLVEDRTRRMLASREFEISVPASSEDPYGGVVAANRAVQSVLSALADFCAEQSRQALAARQ